jgi:hypothetical protein
MGAVCSRAVPSTDARSEPLQPAPDAEPPRAFAFHAAAHPPCRAPPDTLLDACVRTIAEGDPRLLREVERLPLVRCAAVCGAHAAARSG